MIVLCFYLVKPFPVYPSDDTLRDEGLMVDLFYQTENGNIIGSSFFLFHDVEKIVFGFVEMFVSNYIIDAVLNGNRQSPAPQRNAPIIMDMNGWSCRSGCPFRSHSKNDKEADREKRLRHKYH